MIWFIIKMYSCLQSSCLLLVSSPIISHILEHYLVSQNFCHRKCILFCHLVAVSTLFFYLTQHLTFTVCSRSLPMTGSSLSSLSVDFFCSLPCCWFTVRHHVTVPKSIVIGFFSNLLFPFSFS